MAVEGQGEQLIQIVALLGAGAYFCGFAIVHYGLPWYAAIAIGVAFVEPATSGLTSWPLDEDLAGARSVLEPLTADAPDPAVHERLVCTSLAVADDVADEALGGLGVGVAGAGAEEVASHEEAAYEGAARPDGGEPSCSRDGGRPDQCREADQRMAAVIPFSTRTEASMRGLFAVWRTAGLDPWRPGPRE